MLATLQIQYGYSHSNEILPTITFVFNYQQLLLINFIATFHTKLLQTFSIRNQTLYKILNDLLCNYNRNIHLKFYLA